MPVPAVQTMITTALYVMGRDSSSICDNAGRDSFVWPRATVKVPTLHPNLPRPYSGYGCGICYRQNGYSQLRMMGV